MPFLRQPRRQSGRSPFETDIATEPDTWNAFVLWRSGTSMIPNPGFGNAPSRGQFHRINQLRAVSAGLGHQWDIWRFKVHVFIHLAVYGGYRNRRSINQRSRTSDAASPTSYRFAWSNLVLRLALPFLILNRTRLAYRAAGWVVKLHRMLLLLRQIVARRMQLRTLDNSGSSTILGASRVRAGDVRARAHAYRIASNPCGNENELREAALGHIRGSSTSVVADPLMSSIHDSDQSASRFCAPMLLTCVYLPPAP